MLYHNMPWTPNMMAIQIWCVCCISTLAHAASVAAQTSGDYWWWVSHRQMHGLWEQKFSVHVVYLYGTHIMDRHLCLCDWRPATLYGWCVHIWHKSCPTVLPPLQHVQPIQTMSAPNIVRQHWTSAWTMKADLWTVHWHNQFFVNLVEMSFSMPPNLKDALIIAICNFIDTSISCHHPLVEWQHLLGCINWGQHVSSCYKWVHCTTQLEVGSQRGFGQWLQLVHCTNLLLLQVWVFLESSSTSLELNLNSV